MREVWILAKHRWRGVRNDLATSSSRQMLAAGLIALNLVGALFAYRGFGALLEGWESLGKDTLFARGMLFLLGILGIAYFLSLVSAAKEFLARSQVPLLLVAPIRVSSLIWAKALAVLADRNLETAVVVLGVPCLLSMQRVGLAGALYLLPLFLTSVLVITLGAVVTVLLVARYMRRWWALVLGLGACLVILLLRWILPSTQTGPAQGWGVRWYRGFATGPIAWTMAGMVVLLLLLWILAWLASRIYVPAWSRLQESKPGRPWLERSGRKRFDLAQRLLLPWKGATRAIVMKDWRTMGRSPLFPVRLLVLLLSWGAFGLVRERLAIQDSLAAVPLVVAFVLVCLQVTVIEPTGNAFAGEGNRLSLILTAPLHPRQILGAKLLAQLAPALVACPLSTLVVGLLVPLSPPAAGLAILLACLVTATNAVLLVGGSVRATDLSAEVSGTLEEIFFEETIVSPIVAYRMALTGASLLFQAANVALLFLPYWWAKERGPLDLVFWSGLVAVWVLVNGVAVYGALRVGVGGIPLAQAR